MNINIYYSLKYEQIMELGRNDSNLIEWWECFMLDFESTAKYQLSKLYFKLLNNKWATL